MTDCSIPGSIPPKKGIFLLGFILKALGKKRTLFECDTFYFKWSSEPREGLTVGRAKEVPSFLRLVQPRELNLRPPAG